MDVARKIGLFLRYAGISQAEMSQRTGISVSKISTDSRRQAAPYIWRI